MRLSKFFRRYSRTLLMVFMSLLLVTFLIQPVLQYMSRKPSAQQVVIGHSAYGEVYNTDLAQAKADQDVLVNLDRMAGMVEPLDLQLLMQEAERMGVHVGREEVEATLAQSGKPEQVQRLLIQLQQHFHRSEKGLYDLMGRWFAALEVWRIQEAALEDSTPRVEEAYRDAHQKADVQVSVIDSRAFVTRVPEPTDEELQAFFDENKDRFAAHTDDKLEFGYRLPDRVRIEFVTIDPKSLEPAIHARERELERYFQENAWKYTKSVGAESPSASRPAAPTRVPMTFDEAKDQVRRDYIKARAVQEAQSLMNQIHDSVYRPWQAERADEQGFRPTPPDALVSFKDLHDQYADRANVIYKQTPLLSQQDLQNYFDDRPDFLKQMAGDQLGSPEPMYVEGTNMIPASELAFRVKGLYTPKSDDRLPVLNLLEPSPVINTRKPVPGARSRRSGRQETPYQPYMFRVVQAEPSAPPASLDEVREQVRSDYKLMKAHAAAGEYARQLAESARSEGLAAAAEQATELKQILAAAEPSASPLNPSPAPKPEGPYLKEFGPAAPPEPVTRDSDLGPYLADSQKLPQEIFAAMEDPAPETGPAHVVVEGDVAKLFKWAVVEVEDLQPLYRGEFEQQRSAFQRSHPGLAGLEVGRGWFDSQNIRLRNGFSYTNSAATQPSSD
jgi:hypothetical protein